MITLVSSPKQHLPKHMQHSVLIQKLLKNHQMWWFTDPESFAKLTDENTRAYFGETLPNPQLVPFPISEVAEIGREKGVPLIVDNTAAPITCRPFDHGAAVVVHSCLLYTSPSPRD